MPSPHAPGLVGASAASRLLREPRTHAAVTAAAPAPIAAGISTQLDEEIVALVLRVNFPGVTTAADVERYVKRSGKRGQGWNEVGVAYQLLAERKRSRARASQIESATLHEGDAARVPPVPVFAAAGTRITIPGFSPGEQAAAAAVAADVAEKRRRRWYLGIQSKKEPAHVVYEVFRALRGAGFEWKARTVHAREGGPRGAAAACHRLRAAPRRC